MNRLKEVRKERNLTQVQVAEYIGITQSTYSDWEKGKVQRMDNASIAKLSELYGKTIEYLLGYADGSPEPSSPNGVMVPVLGDVAGGIPMLAQENIIDYEEVSKDLTVCGDIIGLRVNGHSMEPRICDGDVVIVRLQGDVDTGDVAVVLINGDSATVKKIKKDADGSIWLIPNNPAYEAVHYSPQERDDLPVTIIGKVVELRGKF
ncbi:LexA family transcriptional regulator [Oscillibacter sp.]|uniref:LexA family protein n=1 Tax=Oscillibacter sp. TaxID=1945593 RepID=UPI00289E8B7E|nr:LexA family transcriptional regulator [Oscillibacter sp.]